MESETPVAPGTDTSGSEDELPLTIFDGQEVLFLALQERLDVFLRFGGGVPLDSGVDGS